MRLEFHLQVASEISRIMDYYENVAGPELADEFYTELQFYFQKAAEYPESYSTGERDLRRVNLNRFPYHFLFRIVEDRVRVLVVRHHKRRPSLGIHRR
ncbi:MAG TPA: type II toxin-antitoxin system RelE/ParE family toxin [Blastocatellia bacterium]|nr:type II toxin-antitoxin system RelE/ParE family toxin [Blastocatellia bacterium]